MQSRYDQIIMCNCKTIVITGGINSIHIIDSNAIQLLNSAAFSWIEYAYWEVHGCLVSKFNVDICPKWLLHTQHYHVEILWMRINIIHGNLATFRIERYIENRLSIGIDLKALILSSHANPQISEGYDNCRGSCGKESPMNITNVIFLMLLL